MAFTYTKIQQTVIGNMRCWIGTLTFDSSYPTGGEPYAVSNFDMTSNPTFMAFDHPLGYSFKHDRTAAKILAYTAQGAEVADTTNLATVIVNIMAVGT